MYEFNRAQPTGTPFSNNFIQHVYWNDPNYLVDRLRELHNSQIVGNNHQIECDCIIEELRKADIIV